MPRAGALGAVTSFGFRASAAKSGSHFSRAKYEKRKLIHELRRNTNHLVQKGFFQLHFGVDH
jgi:hypothetical protein